MSAPEKRGHTFDALVEEAADNVAFRIEVYRLLIELRDASNVWSGDHEDYRRQLLVVHYRAKQALRELEQEAAA